MNIVRLRNGKFRLVAGVGIGFFVLTFIIVAYETRSTLVATRSQAQDCEHRHESLSAQLQVIIEHRSRLEKAVQQEKIAHKQTKDKLESQYEELQDLSEKNKQEAQAKYSALQQQYKTLQRQQEDLHKEFSKLQQINAELQEEKVNLVNKMTSEMDQLRIVKDKKSVQFQETIDRLEREKEDLLLKIDQNPIINQLQTDLGVCRMQLKTTSSPLHNNTKPFTKIVKAEESLQLSQIIPEAIKQKTVKDTNNLEVVEQIPAFDFKNEAKLNAPDAAVEPVQEDKNNRQIPPPLSNNVNNNPKHYLLDNEVNNPEDVRQVEQPDPQNKNNDVESKKVGHQPLNKPAMGAYEQLPDKKGLEVIKDPAIIANGLEQQDNDGDQDLDNMEADVEDKKNVNQFDGADFDQADQDDANGNRNNNDVPVKQEGVIVAPR